VKVRTGNRIIVILTVPFFWPYRLVQMCLGFPVDMGELNRQIRDMWNRET
jgi:hypothetical protein